MSVIHSPPSPLLSAIDHFASATILCIGDVMLDRFVYGQVERISPEAPIPVMRCERESVMLGGAGNVLRNIVSLGAAAGFISVVGEDAIGEEIAALTQKQPRCQSILLRDASRCSTEKTRYVAHAQQMFRADRENTHPLSDALRQQVIQALENHLPHCDLIVISDYAKGLMDESLLATLMTLAQTHAKPVIADPKARDFSRYRGAYLLTPNLKEFCAAAGREVKEHAQMEQVAREMMLACSIRNLIVTLGAAGMLIVPHEGQALHIAAQKREVFDVSGAGDTVLATLAAALASGQSLEDAAMLANIAAGIAVSRTGTATVYRTDLKTAVYTQDVTSGSAKIYPLDLAAEQTDSWRQDGLRVGFTNGCFDMVHPGHLALLADAKAQCDRLIVAINSDASVKRLKGDSRPINAEMERALLLAELRAVDMVVIFREDTPQETLQRLRPDVLMKGGDYTLDQVVGRDLVESYGGRVLTIPLREGYSTTATIAKIQGGAG